MKRSLLFALLLALPNPAAMQPGNSHRAAAVGTVEVQRLPQASVADEGEEPDAPMPTPTNLPVPMDVVRRVVTEPIADNVVYAPAVTMQSFPAIDDDNTALPPDTNGAAGSSHLVTLLNTALRIQDRNGAVLQTVSTRSFFDSVRNLGRVFDPHVVFDPRANRWLICAITDQRTSSTAQRTGSALLLAISKTSNPLLAWDLYRYDGPEGGVWLDFPDIGYDDESIVISVNLYGLSDDKFVRANVFVINRADPAGAFTRLEHVTNGGGSLAPTISMDPGVKKTFLVQTWNGNFQNIGFVRLYSVSSAGIIPIAFASTSATWDSSSGSAQDFAPQLGRAEKIDAGDGRMHSAVLRNGNIWATHMAFVPSGAPTRTAVNWWRLTTTGGVVGRGTIDDLTSTFAYTHPSIAVNRNNDALIGCSRFSATTLPSAIFALVGAGSPVPVVFKSGESSYFKTGTGTKNRWGDYSAACVDPTNDLDFWTIQEYASIPSPNYDRWGTWWARIAAPVIQSTPSRRRSVKH